MAKQNAYRDANKVPGILAVNSSGEVVRLVADVSGKIQMKIAGIDFDGSSNGIDASTQSLQMLDYEHHEIHSGSHFFVCGFESEDTDGEINFAVTTPDTDKEPHMLFEIAGTSRTEIYVYEDAVVSAGTSTEPVNNNRRSATSSVVELLKDPAIVSGGTLIFSQSSGKEGATPSRASNIGITKRDREIILKKNSTTRFRIVSKDDGNIISYCGEWYEHTPKN